MKKITGILALLAVLAGTMIMSGCDLFSDVRDYMTQSYNKWYKYTGSTEINIPLGADEEEESGNGSQTLKNAEFYVYFDPNAGLTVAVQSTKQQDVELFGIVSQTMTVTMGGTKLYPIETFGEGRWIALKNLVSLTPCEAPKVYTNPEECFILGGDNPKAAQTKIQWKKVLTRVLLEQLLGESL